MPDKEILKITNRSYLKLSSLRGFIADDTISMTNTSIMAMLFNHRPHPDLMILSAIFFNKVMIKTGYESNKVELGSEIDSVIDSVEEWYGENLKDCDRAADRLTKQVKRISFQVYSATNNNNQINYWLKPSQS